MPYYDLRDADKNETLATPAQNLENALEIFGKQLGVRLTLEDQGVAPPYMLDEWHEGPHWVNPTIPVFRIPN
jgi:hypothetical protein